MQRVEQCATEPALLEAGGFLGYQLVGIVKNEQLNGATVLRASSQPHLGKYRLLPGGEDERPALAVLRAATTAVALHQQLVPVAGRCGQ